ncbi:exopolysaccharide biosynthesis polyprenyl glycosylphosphotransferase [Acetoanaerobium pronyense]|uniref:Exopolysaccharide biosynthesis polyprenyl glycosylphosphotransferase n=1 Tax=Acetoanaerobium pronyense TaxID=1482736 RepID=A0ABS4KHE1_9FIRM|nr:sugar transferase [Acetoanaerobium pronyense]MBP2027198.1 exopolysaccharide biosynthesis polyprenyl glycosylphosphotransferase [Acetoanaerobium pronyense]
MLRWRLKLLIISYVVVDIIAIIISSYIAKLIKLNIVGNVLEFNSTLEVYGFITLVAGTFILVFLITETYKFLIISKKLLNMRILLRTMIALMLGYGIVRSIFFFSNIDVSQLFMNVFILVFFLISTIFRTIFKLMWFYKDENSEKVKNIIIFGFSESGAKYIKTIRSHSYLGLNIVGYLHIKENIEEILKSNYKKSGDRKDIKGDVDFNEMSNNITADEMILEREVYLEDTTESSIYNTLKHLGSIDDWEKVVSENIIDEIVVAKPLSYDKRLRDILDICQERGITITMLLERQNYESAKAQVSMIGDIPALKFHTVSLNEDQLFAKRLLDILGASVGMMIFGVAYLIFAPLIKLESKGPVIFKQERVGKNGRIFKIWKFRSMCNDAEEKKEELQSQNEMKGNMFKLKNDPRVTKIGNFMRKTSIDELPQFYNVLVGDMSLVGTRPPTVQEVKDYNISHYKRISIIPGITGMWQISGRSQITDFEEVTRLDNEYIENWTIWLDVEILIKTVYVVLKRKGSS